MVTLAEERVAWLAPLVRGAFDALARILPTLDPANVKASLRAMATDPTEAVIWENTGPSARDTYDAGGPLGAERIEFTLEPAWSGTGLDVLQGWLHALATGEAVRLQPGKEPWCIQVWAPGLPRARVEFCPEPDRPEDLQIRIVLGSPGPATRLLQPAQLEAAWKSATALALQRWIARNQVRPLTAHPAFATYTEEPELGMPGLCLVRRPPLPYSPLLPFGIYQGPVAWAVVETMQELAGCAAYHRQPGASISTELPLFRYRPPSSLQPGRMANNIAPDVIRVVRTPWQDVGMVSVYTLSDDSLRTRPQLRRDAHRGRYLIHVAEDAEQTLALWRSMGLTVQRIERPTTWH